MAFRFGPLFKGLLLEFTSINNTPVANPYSVSDWNTFFNLPTSGTPFNKVNIVNNKVYLYGGANILLKSYIFYGNSDLVSIEDTSGCVVYGRPYSFYNASSLTTIILPAVYGAQQACFSNCQSLKNLSLPAITYAGDNCFDLTFLFGNAASLSFPLLHTVGTRCFYNCFGLLGISLPSAFFIENEAFYNCGVLDSIYIPSCQYLGTSVGYNAVFTMGGRNVNLTVRSSLMTCNSGNPDGDIQWIQANNTATITTV